MTLTKLELTRRREKVLHLLESGLPHSAIATSLRVSNETIQEDIRWWRKSLGFDNTPLQDLAECVWADEELHI